MMLWLILRWAFRWIRLWIFCGIVRGFSPWIFAADVPVNSSVDFSVNFSVDFSVSFLVLFKHSIFSLFFSRRFSHRFSRQISAVESCSRFRDEFSENLVADPKHAEALFSPCPPPRRCHPQKLHDKSHVYCRPKSSNKIACTKLNLFQKNRRGQPLM